MSKKPSSQELRCISPIDGRIYAVRQAMELDHVQNLIKQSRLAQRDWRNRPLEERMTLVKKAVAELCKNPQGTAIDLAHQMGRPVRYGGEFGGVKERSTAMLSLAESALEALIIEDSPLFLRKIEREPRGIVLAIAPWNYPYMTAINTIVPALIAGNAVFLKSATQTMLAGEHFQQAFHEVGIPKAVFQNLLVTHDTIDKLIADHQFDFINFVGSVNGGASIERSAAGTFVTVGTELGGKDPAYICEDANLDKAVDTVIDGAMYNSGQCCCGIERIYVHKNIFDEFVDRAVGLVNKYKLDNPLDKETTLGPMASARFAAEVRQQIEDAVSRGATAHIKKFAADDGGAYLSPQVLTNVNHEMPLMREENFGPVVGIMSVNSDAEAVQLMNDSLYGLTASIWTNDAERAAQLGAQIETGTVFMNRCDYLDPFLCWTGCKDTGNGTSLSVLGYHSLTKPKSYHLKKQ